ncbi:MAG: alcohol dehydrogenase, partial [Ruminiclostridium sp.]|nr:alcohol dehydrogenase [Ruminiclostridium sp.]
DQHAAHEKVLYEKIVREVKEGSVATQMIEPPVVVRFGIDKDEFLSQTDKMAEDALASGSPGNTVKPVTKEDIIGIYKSLWN